MFQKQQDKQYLDLVIKRMESDKILTWVEQFLDIISDRNMVNSSLNDIGCQVGQFWKGVLSRKYQIDYNGYDIEPIYLEKAKELFPGIKDRFQKLDISSSKPNPADITIISASLEHVESYEKAIENLVTSTKKLIIIRTFLGEKDESGYYHRSEDIEPFIIHQFSFKNILKKLEEAGFKTKIVRDKYTDSMPRILDGMIRTFYIIVGEKD